jgi:hypothetical protein
MPYLELTPDMIGRGRSRLTLAYIEGVMLWPAAGLLKSRFLCIEAQSLGDREEHQGIIQPTWKGVGKAES